MIDTGVAGGPQYSNVELPSHLTEHADQGKSSVRKDLACRQFLWLREHTSLRSLCHSFTVLR